MNLKEDYFKKANNLMERLESSFEDENQMELIEPESLVGGKIIDAGRTEEGEQTITVQKDQEKFMAFILPGDYGLEEELIGGKIISGGDDPHKHGFQLLEVQLKNGEAVVVSIEGGTIMPLDD